MIDQLLISMQLLVRSYHPEVRKTGSTLPELISGTAFFPEEQVSGEASSHLGGCRICSPARPSCLLATTSTAHQCLPTFDAERRGEQESFFWGSLLEYLSHACIDPEQCFFTKCSDWAQAQKRRRPHACGNGIHDECQAFLNGQIRIVNPSLIVALGQKAYSRVSKLRPAVPLLRLLHPSARELKPCATRRQLIEREGNVLRHAYTSRSRALATSGAPGPQ